MVVSATSSSDAGSDVEVAARLETDNHPSGSEPKAEQPSTSSIAPTTDTRPSYVPTDTAESEAGPETPDPETATSTTALDLESETIQTTDLAPTGPETLPAITGAPEPAADTPTNGETITSTPEPAPTLSDTVQAGTPEPGAAQTQPLEPEATNDSPERAIAPTAEDDTEPSAETPQPAAEIPVATTARPEAATPEATPSAELLSTEAPAEAPTEVEPTEAPAEVPTEASTEAPTEDSTEAPSDAAVEAPAEARTDAATEEEAGASSSGLAGAAGEGAAAAAIVDPAVLARPNWVPDADAERCSYCIERFTVRRRRHHCRCCGLVVCYSCLCTSSPPVPAHFLTVKDRAKAALGTSPPICIWCGPVLTSGVTSGVTGEVTDLKRRIGRVHMCVQPRQLTQETQRQMWQITGGRNCLWLFNPHLAASSQGLDIIRGLPTAQVTMPRGAIVLHLKRFLLEAMRYMGDAQGAAHLDAMPPEDLALEIGLSVSGEPLPDNATLGDIEFDTLQGQNNSRILVKYELNMSREERDALVARMRDANRPAPAAPPAPEGPPPEGRDAQPAAEARPREASVASDETEEDDLGAPDGLRCTVCYDTVSLFLPNTRNPPCERPGTVLVCGHAFHLDCIGSFFNAVGTGAMTCPNCRQAQPGTWRVPTPEAS